ncbi:hypothetical protein DDZ14_02655 [Maritimibacter sp. 55A14]|nr:hypothetical protein DDZ14_02655 [Maritimibacter sp. 55A14]
MIYVAARIAWNPGHRLPGLFELFDENPPFGSVLSYYLRHLIFVFTITILSIFVGWNDINREDFLTLCFKCNCHRM